MSNKTKEFVEQPIDTLYARLSQLTAMLSMTMEDGRGFFRLSDEIQENYLWACIEVAEQAKQAADKV